MRQVHDLPAVGSRVAHPRGSALLPRPRRAPRTDRPPVRIQGARRPATKVTTGTGQTPSITDNPNERKNTTGPDHRPVIATDDGPRPSTDLSALAGLRAVFREEGTVTAGNACPLNDGAAALVIMSDQKAAELGLTPLVPRI